jgi:hypothetical protein
MLIKKTSATNTNAMVQDLSQDKLFNPDLLFKNIAAKVPKNVLISITSTIVIFLIVHLYYFTHNFINHDTLFYRFASGNTIDGGRWLFKLIGAISSYYDLPSVVGFLCMLYLAITVALTVHVLRIKSVIGSILISGFMVVFPTITTSFLYRFSADTVMFGFLLSTLSVLLSDKYKYGFFIGSILLALSGGIYQANITYGVSLSVLVIIVSMLRYNSSAKSTIISGLKHCLNIVLGTVLYLIISKIFIVIYNVHLIQYQGINKMGQIEIMKLPALVLSAVNEVYLFYFSRLYINVPKVFYVLNFIFILFSLFFLINLVIRKSIYNNLRQLLLLVTLLCLFPVSVGFIKVVSTPETSIYMLMIYSFVHIYLFGIAMYDVFIDSIKSISFRFRFCETLQVFSVYIFLVISSVLIYKDYIHDNIVYLRMEIFYENTYGYLNRLLSRIEGNPQYKDGKEIALMGTIPANISRGNRNPHSIFDNISKKTGVSNKSLIVYNSFGVVTFFRNWLGRDFNWASEEKKAEILHNKKFNKMPLYPESGSIDEIEGVLVVKISN